LLWKYNFVLNNSLEFFENLYLLLVQHEWMDRQL
jgi:hypothetical protein